MPARPARFFLASALPVLLAAAAAADVLRLKNGGVMEGAVVSETRTAVVLDVGYGTVSVDKAEIASIAKAGEAARELRPGGRDAARSPAPPRRGSAQARENTAPTRPRFAARPVRPAPPGEEAAEALMRKAAAARAGAFAERDSRDASERDLLALKKRYGAAAARLEKRGPGADAAERARLEAEVRNAAVGVTRLETAEAERLKRGGGALAGYLAAYREAELFCEREAGKPRPAAGAAYHAWLREELDAMRRDFIFETVLPKIDGNRILVEATLDGELKAKLLLEPTSPMTLLGKTLADRLGVGKKDLLGFARLGIGGATAEVPQVLLRSIAVGSAAVAGTPAVVLPTDYPDADGALGASFLSRFNLRAEDDGRKLVLEGLN